MEVYGFPRARLERPALVQRDLRMAARIGMSSIPKESIEMFIREGAQGEQR